MSVTILRADALALPLADSSIDLVVTSPPYFGLRSYQDGGEHYAGQIGSEATPAEFLDALIAATREMVRVLKPSGSIWVNLGDKYASSGGHGMGATSQRATRTQYLEQVGRSERNTSGVSTKSLIGIPWRYALRCIDDIGLILRAEVIWSKPNGLPESVTDRVRRSHEQWFHFTREPRYFSAVDDVREAHTSPVIPGRRTSGGAPENEGGQRFGADGSRHTDGHALGKLPGSVWTVPTEPLHVPAELGVDHFAAFPTELPRRIITGWSPREVCTACGEGRRPVAVQERTSNEALRSAYCAGNHGTGGSTLGPRNVVAHIVGEACACPDTSAPTTPGVVLDPCGGTGTTTLVADVLGRDGISVDLSADYCRLAEWRTTDPRQRARAARVEPVEPVPDGQLSLFGEPA